LEREGLFRCSGLVEIDVLSIVASIDRKIVPIHLNEFNRSFLDADLVVYEEIQKLLAINTGYGRSAWKWRRVFTALAE
jgi:uncharacterized protein YqkB